MYWEVLKCGWQWCREAEVWCVGAVMWAICNTKEDFDKVFAITCRDLLSRVRVVKDYTSPRIATAELSARIKQRAKVCCQLVVRLTCVLHLDFCSDSDFCSD